MTSLWQMFKSVPLNKGVVGFGVHVPLGVHLLIRRGTSKATAEGGKNIFTYYLFPNIYTYITEYYYQKSLYAYC